jgi:6-phosphogluconolactonase
VQSVGRMKIAQLMLMLMLMLMLAGASITSHAKTIIYTANTDAKTISVFQLDNETPSIHLLQTLSVEGAVMPMAVRNNRLYAALRSAPYGLAVLHINPVTGFLHQRTTLPLVDNMANISLDPQGRYLFAASYAGHSISVQPLDDQGLAAGPVAVLATGHNPHQITLDPAGQFVLVSLLGEDRLESFAWNANAKPADALLRRQPALAVQNAAGSGARHFVFSAAGDRVYLLNELSAQLQVFARDIHCGRMSLIATHTLLPSGVKPWAADIHLTPNGKWLYVSERTSSKIYGFSVDQAGALELLNSWPTEAQPRAFAISPKGNYLAVVGQLSNHLSLYAIHQQTGELSLRERIATGANPSWVEIIER